MPSPPRSVRRLPHVLDNLSLVKRFVEEVPVSGRKWKGFQKAAVDSLDEVIFILLPSGLGFPCPTRVLPRGLEPYYSMLPCKTKVMQRMVEGGLAAIPIGIPVCTTMVLQKTIQPMLTAKRLAMPVCRVTVLPKNVRFGTLQQVCDSPVLQKGLQRTATSEVRQAARRKK